MKTNLSVLVSEHEVGRKPLSGLLRGFLAQTHLCRLVHRETTLLVSCFSSPRKPVDPFLQSPGGRIPLMVSCPLHHPPHFYPTMSSGAGTRCLAPCRATGGVLCIKAALSRSVDAFSLQCTHVYFMRGRECKLHFSHHVVYIFSFPRWKRLKKMAGAVRHSPAQPNAAGFE